MPQQYKMTVSIRMKDRLRTDGGKTYEQMEERQRTDGEQTEDR